MKSLAILGSTGSIGTNCLQVVATHAQEFEVRFLTTYGNVVLLFEQARRYHPKAVAVVQMTEDERLRWQQQFAGIGVEFYVGEQALVDFAGEAVDVVVNAIVGAAGLPATLRAVENGATVALANKETLVTGGELVTSMAAQTGARLIPIDSEHSAIFQCLQGEPLDRLQRLILTASGGPFRELPMAEFAGITSAQALAHPNWDMGPKITIDSATMMNKGLEVIEARWLFDLPLQKISVLIHPQSIIHSLVEFVDGSIKAQLGLPDMRLPIQYALTYPDRLPNAFPRLDLAQLRELTFFEPDFKKFACLRLAVDSLREGGTAPAVLNASNEEAVNAFLTERLRFDEIPVVVDRALQQHRNGAEINFENIIAADRWARRFVADSLQA